MLTTTQLLPRWARAMDVAAVVFIALGASVTLSGGFRERTAFGVFSMTSAIRPIAVGLVFLFLRHSLRPDPWIGARISSWFEQWRRSADARIVLPVFLTTRIGVLVIGFLGVALLGYAPNMPPYRAYDNDFLNLPARWDTGWYVGIAEQGYAWDPANADRMQNIAYFPAYPIAIRYSAFLVGRQRLWAGVLISFISFFFALRYLHRLARETLDEDAAAAAVVLLAAYPFAFFFSTAYTESLFLLATVAACFHFQRDELWKASAWGLLAGLTRPNGCFLSIVLGLMALRSLRNDRRDVIVARVLAAATPAAGMLLFSAYIYGLTGNPLQWAAAHAAFGRVYRSLDPLVERVRYIQHEGFYTYASTLTLDMINVFPIVFAVAGIWPIWRRFGLPYAVMVVLSVVPPVLMGGVLSMGRLTSVVFPLFLWLAAILPHHHRQIYAIGFAMLQALGAITFFTWRPLV